MKGGDIEALAVGESAGLEPGRVFTKQTKNS